MNAEEKTINDSQIDDETQNEDAQASNDNESQEPDEAIDETLTNNESAEDGSDGGESDSGEPNNQEKPAADDEESEAADEDGEVDEAAARIAELEEKLAEAEAQAADHLDRLQRTAAEFQNTKRRQEKQLADSIARAAEGVVNGLIPVMDDFELAFKNLPEDVSLEDDPWASGFQQIQKKLSQLLEDQGVAMMDTEGEFDPNRHEAVSSEPNDDVESGHIIETLRSGYEHKERVLRPALVRVAM